MAAVQAGRSEEPVAARSPPFPPRGLAEEEGVADAPPEGDAPDAAPEGDVPDPPAVGVGDAVASAAVARGRVNARVPKPSWS